MNTFTFRTEAECDIPRALNLLKLIGAKNVQKSVVSDANCDAWKLGIFTFETSRTFKATQDAMWRYISQHQGCIDLHRCAQTLNEGTEPNNDWFMN